jgi:hypothetical protein
MSLTTPLSVFPGFKPGQSFALPPNPIRHSTWNYKETAKWNNSRQQAINGRAFVLRYWTNPLWDWEWTYGSVLFDDPSGEFYGLNPFYPQPIPATDKQILQAFYNSMQGGSQFAYQPADSLVGGTMTITGVYGNNNLFTIYGANTASLGQIASISGLTGANFLNAQNLTVLACSPTWILVYFVHANYAYTADSGTAFCGQPLTVDANNNAELVHTTGAFPTLLSGAPVGTPTQYTLVTESVQLIDSATLVVKANGGAPPSSTLLPADTVAPYQGLVLQFSSAPTAPVTAAFRYYYPARFSEDTQELSNFMALLWTCSSVQFSQDRL